MLGAPARQDGERAGGAHQSSLAALEASDLTAINEWLCETRVQTVLIVIIGLPLIRLVGGLDLAWLPVSAVCLATAALSPLYRRWMAGGGNLRVLVYAQLILDTLAITAGLVLLGGGGPLFRYFYLMTIVPATMVSGGCGIVLTLVAAAGCALLLALTPLDAVHGVTPMGLFVTAIFVFGAVANQCFFYKRHLRDKNRHLALTGERLAETNAELTVTAETTLGLFEVARAVGNSLDLGIVIDRLHTVAVERLRTEWCATLLVDSTQPSGYRLLASHGLRGAPQRALGAAFRDFGAGLVSEDLVEVVDADVEPAARALHGWGVASGLFTVMRYGNRAVGVFATGYRERTGAFAAFQRELAVGIATQAAVAIENATLHARQRSEAELSAALLRVAELVNSRIESENPLEPLTVLTRELSGCDRVTALLCDPARRTFRVAAGSDPEAPQLLDEVRELEFEHRDFPLLERAAQHGWAEAYEGDGSGIVESAWYSIFRLRAVLAVPLALRGEVIGFLTGGSRRHAGPFDAQVRRLLTGIAHQIVSALENGRLVQNLRAANNLKAEFIGTMSHELRTPLNAIIGYNDLLQGGEFGPVSDPQREVCGKVLSASRQLLELIQSMLDVSRLETGAVPVHLGPIDLGTLLDEVMQQIPTALVKPRVTLSFRVAPDVPGVVSDHTKLKMIVRNLVHNALKFTDEGAVEVDVRCADGGASIGLTVTDSGIGISPEGQAIMFEMFRQVDGSDRRRHDGVGLGLYIVRRLTTLLGGAIAVESEVGCGTTFRVVLPVTRAETRVTHSPALAEALLA